MQKPTFVICVPSGSSSTSRSSHETVKVNFQEDAGVRFFDAGLRFFDAGLRLLDAGLRLLDGGMRLLDVA